MKKIVLSVLLFITLLGCNANSKTNSLSKEEVARVFDKSITREDFDQEMELYKTRLTSKGYELTEIELIDFKNRILDSMIEKVMLTSKMDELEIKSDKDSIQEWVESLIMQLGSEKAFMHELNLKGYTYDQFEKEALYEDRVGKLKAWIEEKQEDVSEDKIEEYYKTNISTFTKQGQIIGKHIVVLTKDKSNKEALKKIKEIKMKISEGLSFPEAAKKFSEGTAAMTGGIIRFSRGDMVKEFEEAAFDAKLNEVTGPIKTLYGYHLLLVENRTEDIISPLSDAREYIISSIRYNDFYSKLSEEANIIKINWADEKK